MGAKLGTLYARAGHEVTFNYARSNEKLNLLAREAGAKARADTPRLHRSHLRTAKKDC
jgi:predicted dinucleotide-binding enzyme